MKNQNNFEKISKRLFPKIKHKEQKNPQLIIAFSGIPGSGKTSISKLIEERYKAVRINNDIIRKIIKDEELSKNEEELEKALQEYIFYLIKNFPFKNKLIILDSSIDRKYDVFLKFCNSKKIDYFIIRLNIPKEKVLKRIKKREKINLKILSQKMDSWIKQSKDFIKNVKPNIELSSLDLNIKSLYQKLDEKLKRKI